jgi:hypothetical protein
MGGATLPHHTSVGLVIIHRFLHATEMRKRVYNKWMHFNWYHKHPNLEISEVDIDVNFLSTSKFRPRSLSRYRDGAIGSTAGDQFLPGARLPLLHNLQTVLGANPVSHPGLFHQG